MPIVNLVPFENEKSGITIPVDFETAFVDCVFRDAEFCVVFRVVQKLGITLTFPDCSNNRNQLKLTRKPDQVIAELRRVYGQNQLAQDNKKSGAGTSLP
jgi:hypothetical protein